MTVKSSLVKAYKILQDAKVSEPEKSADFLMRQVLGWDKAQLITHSDYKLNDKEEKKFRQFIERRSKHEPVWYITGQIEFYGLDLAVNQNVLIPRPETELLVEQVVNNIKQLTNHKKDLRILELGTGSGAISLALANEVKNKKEGFRVTSTPSGVYPSLAENGQAGQNDIKIFASDISEKALKVAKGNAKSLGLDKEIELRQGDLFEPWKGEKFDYLVANLPYIPHEEMKTLVLDIHHWEPRIALDGGREGLEIYERLLEQASDYLNKNYRIFFEIGIGQGEKIRNLATKHISGSQVEIKRDYSNIDRIAIIKGK